VNININYNYSINILCWSVWRGFGACKRKTS